MSNGSRLVVLRGPSGAGKSTVAKLLHEKAVNKTALVEQDYYRHAMFNNLHSELEAPRYVMFAGVSAALEHGYDVILEGFMGMGKYRAYFDELLAQHPDNNHFFYFDVAFEETLRRHKTRPKNETLSESRMHELFLKSGPSRYPGEIIIGEYATAEQAASSIIEVIKNAGGVIGETEGQLGLHGMNARQALDLLEVLPRLVKMKGSRR
jgi:adenylate kinase family enzyme